MPRNSREQTSGTKGKNSKTGLIIAVIVLAVLGFLFLLNQEQKTIPQPADEVPNQLTPYDTGLGGPIDVVDYPGSPIEEIKPYNNEFFAPEALTDEQKIEAEKLSQKLELKKGMQLVIAPASGETKLNQPEINVSVEEFSEKSI
ncbi:MAG: hypothetical protein Q7K42_02690, partial [Candidatus Diapherotrites archaeon]|nr:hypothetical protein [Candidatus Diapherotrites archaeon]